MSTTNDGGPAFPVPGPMAMPNGEWAYADPGMSLRDWFAGQALTSFTRSITDADRVAQAAYKIADAMLAEREKKRKP